MARVLRRTARTLGIFSALTCVGFAGACSDDDLRMGNEGESSGTESGTTGDGFDDSQCEARLSWEPGTGDISSFPTMEMVQRDPARASGYKVVLDAASFPGLEDYGQYTAQVETAAGALDGFGTSADVFVGFDGALENLPAPTDAASPEDLAGFVVMPEGEPAYLVPAEYELTDDATTVLAHPLFPLPASTEVAFFAKTEFGAAQDNCVGASDGMRELLNDPSGDESGELEQAIVALQSLEVISSTDQLAVVHPFPVGSASLESDAVAQYIAGLPEGDFELSNQDCVTLTDFVKCTSTYSAGNFRDGDAHLDVDVDAVAPQAMWDIKLYSWQPLDDGPWPTILYGHGLTGDGEQAENLADEAAPLGFAVVAIDAVQHGAHPSLEGESLAGLAALFAFFAADVVEGNIDALELRDNFRQSTFDKLYLVRALQAGADLDGDGDADVMPAKLAYHGVSLGAIMGVELMSLTDAFQGGVLVMPGARLTTVMTDPMGSFDMVLAALIPAGFSDGDTRRLFSMVQAVLDSADPASYGQMVVQRRKSFAPKTPDLLMGAVLDDMTVPNVANWTAARALGLDIVPPTLRPVVGVGETAASPISGNLHDGEVTAGLLQFDVIDGGADATHTNLSFSDVGLAAWMHFHTTLFNDGQGEIIDPYEAVGLPHG